MPSHLLVVDRGLRGGVELQFSHLLYLARGLHQQLGGVDLALHGTAVTLALADGRERTLRLGSQTTVALPDPGPSLAALLRAGSVVYADRDALHEIGVAADRLHAGVRSTTAADMARHWPDYEGVWFL